MKSLTITGWKPGLDKIALTKVIRTHTGLGLADAKKCTDDVVENRPVVFERLNSSVADAFLTDVRAVGAIAAISENTT